MFASACRRSDVRLLVAAGAGLVLVVLAGFGPAPVAKAGVLVNELMASNGRTLVDENGDASDWFELYNAGPDPVALSGWGISDNANRPFKWIFQHGTIDPGGFLLVYASGKDRQPVEPGPISPATLSDLSVWLRAEAILPDDPAQVRRVGERLFVRRWRNLTPTGGDAIQETGVNQPEWLADAGDGRPVLRFDGVRHRLELPAPPGTNDFSVFVVFRTARMHETDPEGGSGVGGTAGQRYLLGARHGGDTQAGMGLSVGTNGVAVYEHGSGYMPARVVYQAPLGTGWILAAVDYAGRQPTLDVQGIIARTGGVSPRSVVTAPIEIGAGAYGAFDGDLAELVVFRRSLAPADRAGMARYFADRYSLRLAEPRHTNFKLSVEGEELVLTRPDGRPADHVRFGPQERDVSFGRQPDGGAAWVYFDEPTPGAANLTPGAIDLLAAPAFSHPAGFYRGAFDLELRAPGPGVEVRFTVDGSEPVVTSTLYTAPLRIQSRAGTPNDLSRIPTVPGGPTPAGEVFKGWVVRARSFQPDARPSPTVTRTFWISPFGRAHYRLPVLSLATDRANFFDPAIGIYVPGNAPGGNYSQRGPEWERDVHVEFFETDGSVAFAQDGDVKIHGNTSQGFPIKGLDLDGTGGKGRQPFRHRLFPGRERDEFEHFLLRPSGHDQQLAFLRDELMQSLAAGTGAESQASRACIVFLNGEYWGLHYLKEKQDTDFVSHYGKVPPEELDYLEGYAAARAGDTAHYEALLDFLAGLDLRQPDAFDRVDALLDVANYIDYKIFEIFNYRWDIGNHRFWRPRTPEGRWRWLQFDNDVGWGGFWAEQPAWQFDMLRAVLTPDGSLHGHNNEVTTWLLRRLLENPRFRRDFINRFADLLNTALAPGHTVARLEAFAAVLEPEMADHIRRWRSPASVSAWRNQVQEMRQFAERRPDAVRRHLEAWFGLRGTANLTVSVSAPGAGRVQVNTIAVDAVSESPWTGVYFLGHPLTLTAENQPGHRFAGWRGLAGVSTPSVTLLLNGDLAVQAEFVVEEALRPRLGIAGAEAGGDLAIEVTGPARTSGRIESSSNLRDWRVAGELTFGEDGRAVWPLPPSGVEAERFYRVRLVP